MGRQTAIWAIVGAFALPVSAAAQEGTYIEWSLGAVVAPGAAGDGDGQRRGDEVRPDHQSHGGGDERGV